MKLSRKVLIVLVVVAAKSYAVIASTLRSSSKNDGGGTKKQQQVAQAFPVSYNKVSQNGILFQKFTTEDSTKSKPATRSHHGDHHDHKNHRVHHKHDYDTNSTETIQRIILQVRNTLENVDIDKLRGDEIVFFEDSWKIAFQTINEKEDDDHHGKNGDDHIVRSVIVSQKELDRDGNRMLRGGQFIGSWFDVWTIVELYTCCPQKTGNHNDKNEEAVDTEQHTALDLQHHFENLLCKMLRKGPHERFHKVKNCKVAFTDW